MMLNIKSYTYVCKLKPFLFPKRNLWEYVNKVFNQPDLTRIKAVGPDRACAEWVLRNGGSVSWEGGQKLSDYNSLPSDDQVLPKIIEIDGSNSSISFYGFPHFEGCSKLKKLILHDSTFIDYRAMKALSYGKNTLTHIQVSECPDVNDQGLKEVAVLNKLNEVVLFNLKSVIDMKDCIEHLESKLPGCKITVS